MPGLFAGFRQGGRRFVGHPAEFQPDLCAVGRGGVSSERAALAEPAGFFGVRPCGDGTPAACAVRSGSDEALP